MTQAFERACRRPGEQRDAAARAELLRKLGLTEDTLVPTSCSSAVARYVLASDLSQIASSPIGDGVNARDVSAVLRGVYSVCFSVVLFHFCFC